MSKRKRKWKALKTSNNTKINTKVRRFVDNSVQKEGFDIPVEVIDNNGQEEIQEHTEEAFELSIMIDLVRDKFSGVFMDVGMIIDQVKKEFDVDLSYEEVQDYMSTRDKDSSDIDEEDLRILYNQNGLHYD